MDKDQAGLLFSKNQAMVLIKQELGEMQNKMEILLLFGLP